MSYDDLQNGRSTWTLTWSNTGGEEYEGECKTCKEKDGTITSKAAISLIAAIPENEIDQNATLYRKGWFRGWNAFREELHLILEKTTNE